MSSKGTLDNTDKKRADVVYDNHEPGWRVFIRKAIRRVFSYIYYKEENLILKAPLKLTPSAKEKVDVRNSESDPEFLKRVEIYFPHKYKLFKNRLEQSIRCCELYSEENELVAYTWGAVEDYYEPKMRYTFHLEPNQIYQFDGFVTPKARKGLIASVALRCFWNYFASKGYTSTIASVNKANTGNLKIHAFIGFKETGKMTVTHYIFRQPYTVLKTYSGNYMKTKKSKV